MKHLFFSIAFLAVFGFSFAQLRVANSASFLVAYNSSAFIDASSSTVFNRDPNLAKGLLFPRTSLRNFTAFGGTPIGSGNSYPNFYDGLIVYNTDDDGYPGYPDTDANKKSPLSRGFYYYENTTRSINAGVWKKIGSAVNIETSNETITNTTIDGEPIYIYKNQFEVLPNQTKYTLALPVDGIGALYKITIYNKDLGVFVNTVYSFDTASGEVVTGYPNMSVVYQPGTYNYVLEYLKP